MPKDFCNPKRRQSVDVVVCPIGGLRDAFFDNGLLHFKRTKISRYQIVEDDLVETINAFETNRSIVFNTLVGVTADQI